VAQGLSTGGQGGFAGLVLRGEIDADTFHDGFEVATDFHYYSSTSLQGDAAPSLSPPQARAN
jgi:hypothetical protein